MKSVATITAALMLAASTLSAADYFSVDFEAPTNAVGDNYTSVAGVGKNTNLVGALPNKITAVNAAGSWQAIVETAGKGQRLNFSSTAGGDNQSYFEILSPQAAPAAPETWFIQFDYTRLASTTGLVGVNFLNGSGANMLGHPNTATLFADVWEGSPEMAVGSTHTLRMEIDSGTTVGRGYIDGVKFKDFVVQSTDNFGGIRFNAVAAMVTDMKIDNISGGVVSAPRLSLIGADAGSLLMALGRN